MSTFKSLEEAQAYFKGDRFATENGRYSMRISFIPENGSKPKGI